MLIYILGSSFHFLLISSFLHALRRSRRYDHGRHLQISRSILQSFIFDVHFFCNLTPVIRIKAVVCAPFIRSSFLHERHTWYSSDPQSLFLKFKAVSSFMFQILRNIKNVLYGSANLYCRVRGRQLVASCLQRWYKRDKIADPLDIG